MWKFYDWFDQELEKARHLYLGVSLWFIRKAVWVVLALVVVATAALLLAKQLPTAFLPEEDQGYAFYQSQLPFAASLERTDKVAQEIEQFLKNIPGVGVFTPRWRDTSLLPSQVQATSRHLLFFVSFKPVDRQAEAARTIQRPLKHG